MNKIRPIAFYLPQYHPIPENNEWWGKGFTEWTNVAKAKPLFEGHWQPRLPSELGFYDLRVAETRAAQAELAKQYGIYGFSYWHYWFGGKQILERPLEEVVSSGEPIFPFCIAWANQTWKGTWHGLSSNKVLVEQTYPGKQDYEAHFYYLLKAFQDPRYIEVNGKKLFQVFQPLDIPNNNFFTDCWQNLAIKEGINGFHFVGMHMPSDWNPQQSGYSSFVQAANPWERYLEKPEMKRDFKNRIIRKLKPTEVSKPEGPRKVYYKEFVEHYPETKVSDKEYPLIFTDWDNTARSGKDGWLFKDFSFDLFEQMCYKGFEATANKPENEKFVFVKSWNEWAEGNYLEPDQKHGRTYLETFYGALTRYNNSIQALKSPVVL
jgi:hypothetical protein